MMVATVMVAVEEAVTAVVMVAVTAVTAVTVVMMVERVLPLVKLLRVKLLRVRLLPLLAPVNLNPKQRPLTRRMRLQCPSAWPIPVKCRRPCKTRWLPRRTMKTTPIPESVLLPTPV